MKKIQRILILVVLVVLFTAVGLLTRDIVLAEYVSTEPLFYATPVTTPTTGEREPMMLVAPEGKADLRDEPCGEMVRFTKPAGTLVRPISAVHLCGATWHLVELVDGEGRGWVPASTLIEPGTSGPQFSNFIFVAGSAASPEESQRPPTLNDSGIWVQWDYSGLRNGDVVQWVLHVNGERYASQPILWNGPTSGKQLINLMELQPRMEPGEWQLWFFVNDEYTGQAILTLR